MKVEDFMNKEPVIINPEMTMSEVLVLMRKTRHDGMLVVENSKVVGILTYADIVLQPIEKKDFYDIRKEVNASLDRKVRDVMKKRVVAILPDMSIEGVARLMFRSGHSRFPVVDKEGHALGIITNMDIIRSHLERVTPAKVETMKKTLEHLHNVKVVIKDENIETENLIPTQTKVYTDELRARQYELKKGLAEPLLVVKNGNRFILIDGHHRVLAAQKLGIKEMHSYVLELEKEVSLGIEKTAKKEGLHTLRDIKVLDGFGPYHVPVIIENGKIINVV